MIKNKKNNFNWLYGFLAVWVICSVALSGFLLFSFGDNVASASSSINQLYIEWQNPVPLEYSNNDNWLYISQGQGDLFPDSVITSNMFKFWGESGDACVVDIDFAIKPNLSVDTQQLLLGSMTDYFLPVILIYQNKIRCGISFGNNEMVFLRNDFNLVNNQSTSIRFSIYTVGQDTQVTLRVWSTGYQSTAVTVYRQYNDSVVDLYLQNNQYSKSFVLGNAKYHFAQQNEVFCGPIDLSSISLVSSYGDMYYSNLGYKNIYDSGYNDGVFDGKQLIQNDSATITDGIYAVIDAPFKIIRESLNFKLFGINVAGVVLFLLTTVIVIFVVRKFMGG